jgi:hypothetical protein
MKNQSYKTTHGLSKTKTYQAWADMKTRCYNSKRAQFAFYGGRGISVCDSWKNSFENFLSDMGEKPHGHSLDRIDNNKEYSPSNCRWATQSTQCRNRRTNRTITHNGETLTFTEWSLRLGSYRSLVNDRVKDGWDSIEAVTTPKGGVRQSA